MAVGLALVATTAAAGARETLPLAAVAAYLHEASGGLIGLAPEAAGSAQEFLRPPSDPTHFVPAPPRAPRADQEAFTFDVDGFIARQGAANFLDAKRSFYTAFPWLPEEQAHALPYRTPTAWSTLNHPPIRHLDGPIDRWTDLFPAPPPDADPAFQSPYFDPAFQRRLDAGGTELTHGNRVRLLQNRESYREKLRLIAEAKDHLYVAVMFWACDETADALTDALAARVRDGVDVRVMTEGIYRETITRRCVDRLEAGGIKVVSYRDALRAASMGAVLHWKVWIRDGEELIIGGANVGDYENRSDGFNFLDRDNDVLAKGPVVTDAERSYLTAWEEHGGPGEAERAWDALRAADAAQRARGDRGVTNYGRWLSDPATRMRGNCRVMFQGVGAEVQPVGPVVDGYLHGSQRQLVLSSPTLRYDHHDPRNAENSSVCVHYLSKDLEDAARHQRRVVVLTNGVGGGTGEMSIWLRARRDGAARAGQPYLQRLSHQFTELVGRRAAIGTRSVTVPLARSRNVEVWTYFQFIHSKIWLFDRLAAMVGSWNLERNSTDKNPEAVILCLDAGLRDEVEADLTLALVNSTPDASATPPPPPRR